MIARIDSSGNSIEAALGLGEAISLRAGGQISPEASKLFEDAAEIGAEQSEGAAVRRICGGDPRRSRVGAQLAGRR